MLTKSELRVKDSLIPSSPREFSGRMFCKKVLQDFLIKHCAFRSKQRRTAAQRGTLSGKGSEGSPPLQSRSRPERSRRTPGKIPKAGRVYRTLCKVELRIMGLAQTFQFEYESCDEIESLLRDLGEGYQFSEAGRSWMMSSHEPAPVRIEFRIEDFGLYVHRSGDYFSILGQLVEALTGRFGVVTIEDA